MTSAQLLCIMSTMTSICCCIGGMQHSCLLRSVSTVTSGLLIKLTALTARGRRDDYLGIVAQTAPCLRISVCTLLCTSWFTLLTSFHTSMQQNALHCHAWLHKCCSQRQSSRTSHRRGAALGAFSDGIQEFESALTARQLQTWLGCFLQSSHNLRLCVLCLYVHT